MVEFLAYGLAELLGMILGSFCIYYLLRKKLSPRYSFITSSIIIIIITHFTFPIENIENYINRGWIFYTPILGIIHIIYVKSWKEIWFPFVSWIILYIVQMILIFSLIYWGILPPLRSN